MRKHKDGSPFSKNIYTLVSNPKKFSDSPPNEKDELAYSKIKFSGIKSAGYGVIPKAVMCDERIPIQAKGIYAYFCSFTGSGNNSFPKRENIFYHLRISESTYYRYYQMLVSLNYITVIQRHIKGRLNINDYFLNDMPNEEIAEKKTVIVPDTGHRKIQDTQIQDTEIQDTIINNITSNNLIINQSINQQPATPGSENLSENEMDGWIDEKTYQDVRNDLKCDRQIPFRYNRDIQKMTAAIHILTEWETFYPYGYKDDFMQTAYNLFNEALIEMCCASELMKLRGGLVSYAKVIEKLNNYIGIEGIGGDFYTIMQNILGDYKKAIMQTEIKNHMQYMKACIWNGLQIGDISTLAKIEHDFRGKHG